MPKYKKKGGRGMCHFYFEAICQNHADHEAHFFSPMRSM